MGKVFYQWVGYDLGLGVEEFGSGGSVRNSHQTRIATESEPDHNPILFDLAEYGSWIGEASWYS